MPVKCLLWDFGDTLCDETFIWSSGPEWRLVYEAFDDDWANDWNTGDMDTLAFAHAASRIISLEPQDIISHMRERCRHINFYEFTYAFFKARHLPQAIVTVNPDLWTDTIVPLHEFDKTADIIVSSWEEKTVDKAVLCAVAFERLGIDCRRDEALLIDNKQTNLDAWMQQGGVGYLFTTDATFRQDVSGGIDDLVNNG